MLEEGDSVIGDHSEILGLSFEETVGDQGGGVDREWKRVVGKWSTWILNCEAKRWCQSGSYQGVVGSTSPSGYVSSAMLSESTTTSTGVPAEKSASRSQAESAAPTASWEVSRTITPSATATRNRVLRIRQPY